MRDESALREVVASVNDEATEVFEHIVPAIAAMIDKVPAERLAQAVVVIADRADPTARALSDGILEKLGKVADSDEPIFYTVQPAVRVVELFDRLGITPAPPSLVDEVPADKAGAVRILFLLANAYQVKWWTPRLSRGGVA